MDFLFEVLNKPFRQLDLEQQVVLVLITLVCVFLVVYAIFLVMRRTTKRERQFRRSRASYPVEISWEDSEGQVRKDRGRCRDISAGGLRMELPNPIATETPIKFRVLGKNLEGTALVRHCNQVGKKYFIGAEFRIVSQDGA